MNKEYHDVNEEKKENAAVEEQEEGLLDITLIVDEGWKCFKRCWVWFLAVISLCSSIGWFAVKWSYVPKYLASSTFIVTTNTMYSYNSDYYNRTTASQLSKVFPYIISNSALQYMIAEDLEVEAIPGTISAEAMEGTNLMTISAKANDPQTAYDILQSVLRNYPKVARAVVGNTSMKVLEETGVPQYPCNSADLSGSAKKGFLFGGLICAAWMVLYALGRKTIRREEELKTMLNIRCLAAVPKVQFKKSHSKRRKQILVDNVRVSAAFTESYRTIRTRIERVMRENNSKVFLVSSANASEGKTTMAANLALSLAEKGKKVALLDLDLRNPSVSKAMGMPERKRGMVDVLLGRAPILEVMEKYKETSLSIIPGGKPVQMTARLLNSEALELMFQILSEQMDCIIVDTPPSGLLSDAALIARYADEGIFVVKQDYSTVERIKEGIDMLTDANLHIAGCILNYAEAGITGYGYGSYGKYGKYGKYGSAG